jgi:hypothetical protein
MKRKIFYGIIGGIVLSLSIFNFVYSFSIEKKFSLIRVVNFDYAMAGSENTDDDEQDLPGTQTCTNGTTCECVMCANGNTDCSPTCPCCQ